MFWNPERVFPKSLTKTISGTEAFKGSGTCFHIFIINAIFLSNTIAFIFWTELCISALKFGQQGKGTKENKENMKLCQPGWACPKF